MMMLALECLLKMGWIWVPVAVTFLIGWYFDL